MKILAEGLLLFDVFTLLVADTEISALFRSFIQITRLGLGYLELAVIFLVVYETSSRQNRS